MEEWVLGWYDCDPTQCCIEVFRMWRLGGIREQLTCKQVGLRAMLQPVSDSEALATGSERPMEAENKLDQWSYRQSRR